MATMNPSTKQIHKSLLAETRIILVKLSEVRPVCYNLIRVEVLHLKISIVLHVIQNLISCCIHF